MIRRVFLSFVLGVVALALHANQVGVTALRNNALKGLNVESGYEQEMAAWAYYRINGVGDITMDYNEAVKILEKLVTRDKNKVDFDKFSYVVEGYNMYGDCYKNGWGVAGNINKAVEWWFQAALQGHDDSESKLKEKEHLNAVCNLGWEYEYDEKYTLAVICYRIAAEQGYAEAQTNLGICYYNGNGVPQSYAEAAKWYLKAAEQGLSQAQYNLACCYYNGEGVPQDYAEAVKWYSLSAGQGFSHALYRLGICYENGYGVNENIDKAKEYWQRAANYNHADALKKLAQYKDTDVQPKNIETKKNVTQSNTTQSNTKKENKNLAITVGGVSFKMIYVEGGIFQMGSNESDAEKNEKPVRSVATSDYYIGETEVTQELWEVVMGSNPSIFKGTKKPVDNISWDDCQEFIRKLNDMTGKKFSLPTEVEWEFAARGGNKSKGYKYSGSNEIDDVAWYDVNAYNVKSKHSNYGTHFVGSKQPNELGIYDMSGNVYEWCADSYGYNSSSSPNSKIERVVRGGSWYSFARASRVSYSSGYNPSYCDSSNGLRLVLIP